MIFLKMMVSIKEATIDRQIISPAIFVLQRHLIHINIRHLTDLDLNSK